MKNMALSAEQARDMYACSPSDPGDGPRYPYGLTIRLEDAQMEALGVTAMPEAGQTLVIMARVSVTSVEQSQQQDGDKRRCMSLQITDMEIGPDTAKPSAAQKLYDASEA